MTTPSSFPSLKHIFLLSFTLILSKQCVCNAFMTTNLAMKPRPSFLEGGFHHKHVPIIPTSSKIDLQSNSLASFKSTVKSYQSTTTLLKSQEVDDDTTKDPIFNGQMTITLIGGQSLLIVGSIIAAYILNTPNYGLGSNFSLTTTAMQQGAIATIPLFGLAAFLDIFEERVQALKDVSRATQRSVLALLGTKRKPIIALVTALALGLAAGIGEEMLFRGIFQSEMTTRFGSTIAISSTSVVFGALHAVTPLYAFLASIASVFFGLLFQYSDLNLAVPIVAHALYDVGALLWAHYTVTGMQEKEQMDIFNGVKD